MIDFRNLELSEIQNGYMENEDYYTCIFCEQQFDKEQVFSINDNFYSAKYAIKNHINTVHGGVFEQLINLDKIILEINDKLNFESNIEYSEIQINKILKTIYSDHVTLRRLLIEYGLLQRSVDCLKYWR